MNIEEYEATFNDRSGKIKQVFDVLRDQQWHCRSCEYEHVKITQIAGGAGIQGLERGTKSRPGLRIESGKHICRHCQITTHQDRWTGDFVSAVPAQSMPPDFAIRVQEVLGTRDVVDNTSRPPSQLTVDHKLPMLRWDSETEKAQTDYANMDDDDIRQHFQLLRASNGSVSHNLLKSRTCEKCFKTGKRGTPFGIVFFYDGGPKWEPPENTDPAGCIGCGWYDINAWRNALNAHIKGGKK